MRRLAIVVCVLAVAPMRAEAWNPIKAAGERLKAAGRAIGGVLGAPAGGFIESATTPVIHNVEDAGHRLISDVDSALASNLARGRELISTSVAEVDRSLAARIVQVQTGVDHTVDHAFDRIDLVLGRLEGTARQLLKDAERIGKGLIQDIRQTVREDIAAVDKLLAARVNDLQVLVTSAIQQADDVARARIAQLDELSGRRIGNLDVIATKQSLSLEGMLVRIAALIGLVGLIAFVAWRVFRETSDALVLARDQRASRLRTVGRCMGVRLVPQLALAAGGALLLNFLADVLPRDSERRACQQIDQHEAAFTDAVRALDLADATYQQSQLEILAPAKIAAYRGQRKKVELLHSLFTRPGQLHTEPGLAGLTAQVGEVEAALGVTDPDVMIAKAYILWQVGGTRADEREAAVLCAAALRQGGALLAPLARNYISAFLADPYVVQGATSGGPGADELARLAAGAPGERETHQFDRVIEFDELIKTLDRQSTAAYLDMLAAQADLRVALAARPAAAAAVLAARDARTAAANRLIEAWAVFDRTLESSPFASDAMVLSVFTLDDAVLTRALYYAAVPSDNDLAPTLTGKPAKSLTPGLRARIAPLRVAWEKRYAAMLGPSAREIVAYQETRRFEAFEQRASEFEAAYVRFLVAARTGAGNLGELAAAAATRAAGMGLHRGGATDRATEASHILAIARDHGQHATTDVLDTIARNYQVRRLRLL